MKINFIMDDEYLNHDTGKSHPENIERYLIVKSLIEEKYSQDCIDFCTKWDQISFDPDFDTKPLDYFIPMIKEIFLRKPKSFV